MDRIVFLTVVVSSCLVNGCYNMRSFSSGAIWDHIEEENLNEIKAFFDDGGSPSHRKLITGESLLQFAYDRKRFDAFRNLLQHGADMELELKDGTRILHRTTLDQDPKWLRELIKNGVDVDSWSNGKGSLKGTALHLAAVENRIENFKQLIDASAKVDCPANQHLSPTLYDLSSLGRWEMVLIALDAGGSPTYESGGKTFLGSLINRGFFGVPDKDIDRLVQELAKRGYGEEVFVNALWGERTYDDRLNSELVP